MVCKSKLCYVPAYSYVFKGRQTLYSSLSHFAPFPLSVIILILRLINRGLYPLALEICNYLSIAPANGEVKVLREWALRKVGTWYSIVSEQNVQWINWLMRFCMYWLCAMFTQRCVWNGRVTIASVEGLHGYVLHIDHLLNYIITKRVHLAAIQSTLPETHMAGTRQGSFWWRGGENDHSEAEGHISGSFICWNS